MPRRNNRPRRPDPRKRGTEVVAVPTRTTDALARSLVARGLADPVILGPVPWRRPDSPITERNDQ